LEQSLKKAIINLSKNPKAAAVLAGLLMLVCGVLYYGIAVILEMPINASPIPSDSLNYIPLQIASWNGHDIPVDDKIVQILDTDAYINRSYKRNDSIDSVVLFVACSYSAYDKTYHRPEVCYPSNGWTFINKYSSRLYYNSGTILPFSVWRYSRGDIEKDVITVLHYYIVDGKPFGNLSFAQPRLWRVMEKINYIARVMICTTSDPLASNSAAEQVVSDFAVDSAPFIARLLDDIEKKHKADNSVKNTE
jgi:hypothetical protein